MAGAQSYDIKINRFDSVKKWQHREHFVYIFQSDRAGQTVFKIGHTWNVKLRLRTLKCEKNLKNIEILHVIKSSSEYGSRRLEKMLLSKFSQNVLPKSKEWFSDLPNLSEVVNEVV